MLQWRSLLAWRWVTVLTVLAVFVAMPGQALVQLTNPDFAANATGWTLDNRVNRANNMSTWNWTGADGNPAGSYYANWDSGGNNRTADGIMQQTFVGPASSSRAVCRMSHKDRAVNSYDSHVLAGTLRISGSGAYPNETIVTTFFSQSTTNGAAVHTTWQDTGWVGPVNLGANQTFIVRVYWDMQCDNNEEAGAWVDNVQCCLSPSGLSATLTGANVVLSWNPSVGAATLQRYNIYRSTAAGGPYTLIGNTTSTTYTDISPAGAALVYVITDVDTTGLESPYSPEAAVFRLGVADGLGPDIAHSWWPDRIEASWEHPLVPLLRYQVGVGTVPGGVDVLGWQDVGLANRCVFSGLALASGTTYYTSVRAVDTGGVVQLTESSSGVLARGDPVSVDTASSTYFNNGRAMVMCSTTAAAGAVQPTSFSLDGGNYWRYRARVTVTEPGITERINAPCHVTFAVAAGMGSTQEIRVCDEYGREMPRFNLPTSTTANPDFVFLVNMRRGETRDYWVYWGNPAAGNPTYGFVTNTMLTAVEEYTPYYSRKYLDAGIEAVSLATTNNFGYNAGVNFERATNYSYYRDDAYSDLFTLPWNFYFFGTNQTQWRVSVNGFVYRVTAGNGTDYTNAFNEFSTNTKFTEFICPFWVDLKYDNPSYPQQPGVYWNDLSSPDRVAFTWRCNRYTTQDDIYIFQTVLYSTGDIAHRYDYLSPLGVLGPGGTDQPVNTVNTVGISANDAGTSAASSWLCNTPLNIGAGESPTSLYQCMDAFRGNVAVAAAEAPSGGWSNVGHFDSMPFDSRTMAPTWQAIQYDTVGGAAGRCQIWVRTGATPDTASWGSAWTLVATTNGNGSSALAVPNQRYLQYRVVFQRNAAGALPQLTEVRLIYGSISVEAVTANTPQGVCQGQTGIPVRVRIRNLNNVAVNVASLTLTFDLGTYNQQLIAPALPIALGPGVATDATFTVSVSDTSAVGTATIHASCTAMVGALALTDSDAQTPATWWVRSKARLVIDKIETLPTYVNKGQNGVPVKMFLSNGGETPYYFDGATLTFTLGDYVATLVAPATHTTVVPALGTATVSFSVNVLSTSPSGVAVINGTASGTNTFSGAIVGTAGAFLTDSWTIQNPAVLSLDAITASSPVFRGQTGAPVAVTVTNTGEALAYWDSSTLTFTLGTYDAVHPLTAFPISLYGGIATTARYGVDISPSSVTGTAIIDAQVDGRDGNTLFAVSCPTAAYPGSWTILAEQIQTYKDPSFLFPSTSYNRPGAGIAWVYARGMNLAPFKEYSFRWYDPLGNQVASTNPPLTSDGTGVLSHQFALSPTSPYGVWTVKITNPLNTFTNCVSQFSVVSGASLTCSLLLPTSVSVGQPFTASMTFVNEGGATINSAYPSTLVTGGTGVATWTAGPVPVVQNIAGNTQATFTWAWRATGPGTFIASASGFGYDANSDEFLQSATATSNVCTIQSPPNLTVTALVATPTTVFRNQKNLVVYATVRNSGQAAAVLNAASLTFSLGSYTQVVSSPTLPYTLAGNNTTVSLFFTVDVASFSPTGLANIGASIDNWDANWPASAGTLIGGADSWTIASVGVIFSNDLAMAPEQYTFNTGQTVYSRAFGLVPASQWYRIRYYNSQIPYSVTSPAGWTTVSPQLKADDDGNTDFLYTLPAAATVGTWSALVDNGTGAAAGTMMGLNYFVVQNPGNLVATLSLSPSSVFVGETITATLFATNTVAMGSTIASVTPGALTTTAAAVGAASLVSGPAPDVATATAQNGCAFVWTYEATADTGMVGSFSLTSIAPSSVTGIDVNTRASVGSAKVVSNGVKIYSRSIDMSVPVWNLGTLLCGQTSASAAATVSNTGNYPLSSVSWNKTDLNGPAGAKVSKAALHFLPDPVGAIAAGGNKAVSASVWMPFNQPAGTYSATMAVFEDLNLNANRDTGEPYELFAVQVVASLCQVLVWTDSYVDLGDWMPGNITASKTVSGFNGGNLPCSSVTVKLVSGPAWIYVNPAGPTPLATGAVWTAGVSAVVPPAQPGGVYLATFTMFEDRNSDGVPQSAEASSTFLVRIGVGTKGLTLAPATVNVGTATPTHVIDGIPLTVTNTGQLPLIALRSDLRPVTDGFGNWIASDNFALKFPKVVGTGTFGLASVGIYVPAGTPVGTFSAPQWAFEDANSDGVWQVGEASAGFILQFYVPPWPAIQVLVGTVDVGGLAKGNTKSVSFPCRNIGNVSLPALRFERVALTAGAFTISAGQYSFPPAEPIAPAVPGGLFFNATLQMTASPTQQDGSYVGSSAWLYNDASGNGARNGGEPQDDFLVTVQIGNQAVDILEAGISIPGVAPFGAASATCNIRNTGSLTLSNPMATASALVGPTTLPASCSVFTPKPINYILTGQTRGLSWQVNVPANTPAGVYSGVMTVWEDANADGVRQSTEASDTATLQVTVTSKKVVTVLQNPLDLGWTTANSSLGGTFEVVNVGNVALTSLHQLASDLVSLGNTIGAGNVTFQTVVMPNIGPLAVGASALATVTVFAPALTPDGTYDGWPRVYDDGDGPTANAFDAAAEVSALFRVRMSIGQRSFTVGSPVNFGPRNPGAWYSQGFTLTNTSFVPLSKLRWAPGALTSGGNTIATSQVSFTPAAPFSCAGGGTRACTASLTVNAATPPGVYTGKISAWEDDNSDGVLQSSEASATFQVQVTVNALASFTFVNAVTDAGTVTQNGSRLVEVGFRNTGNVDLTGLAGWNPAALWFNGVAAPTIPVGSLTFVAVTPVVTPGALPTSVGTLTVNIGQIGTTQQICGATDFYRNLIGTPQQLWLNSSVGAVGSTFSLQCKVLSGGPDIATGSVWQAVATATLTPGYRYILSAWVCPATSPALIGFIMTEPPTSGEKVVRAVGVRIDPSGVVTAVASPTTLPPARVGVVGATNGTHASATWHGLGAMNWYRVYVAFDNTFSNAIASRAYIILQNQSLGSGSVWFDAIQLEPAVVKGQDLPTTFTPGPTLVTPREGVDLSGERRYFQW